MPRSAILCRITLAAIAVSLAAAASGAQSRIESVTATSTELIFRLAGAADDEAYTIRAVPVHRQDDPKAPGAMIWKGAAQSGRIRVPRFADGRDRLYRKFQLVRDGEEIGPPKHVTDLSRLSPAAVPLPQPASFKGLQCIVDIKDAIDLGVKHSAVNVSLARLYEETGASSLRQDVDGVPVAIDRETVAALDEKIGRMTASGMRVNIILLNYLPEPSAPATPLVDPRTNRATANGIGGFHLNTDESVRIYRGLVEFLAERYSCPDARHGTVAGYIVGNEIQSHSDWYNLGGINLEELVSNYSHALRVADLAVRRHHPDARVFVSLDHNWTRRQRPDRRRSVAGRSLLDALHARIKKEGDFPWGVAFHPYPENLGDPRTWNDTTATLDFDTRRITFKNLEVLTAYLGQSRYLFDGRRRRIILSEQGFHCLDSAEGEALQAAAYAYAYERVRRIDGIESFIYHRHVDHAGEGGLRLGLRDNRPGTTSRPGEARRIHDLFRVIDTPRGAAAKRFALDRIGINCWDELSPRSVER